MKTRKKNNGGPMRSRYHGGREMGCRGQAVQHGNELYVTVEANGGQRNSPPEPKTGILKIGGDGSGECAVRGFLVALNGGSKVFIVGAIVDGRLHGYEVWGGGTEAMRDLRTAAHRAKHGMGGSGFNNTEIDWPITQPDDAQPFQLA
jgi:hypothetical protein